MKRNRNAEKYSIVSIATMQTLLASPHPYFHLDNSKYCNYFVVTLNEIIMDVSVIPIGNSKGIRLTKTLIDKYNITDTVELILEKDYIIIKPKKTSRIGWEEAFKQMHSNGDDKLLIPDVFEDENGEEWS